MDIMSWIINKRGRNHLVNNLLRSSIPISDGGILISWPNLPKLINEQKKQCLNGNMQENRAIYIYYYFIQITIDHNER